VESSFGVVCVVVLCCVEQNKLWQVSSAAAGRGTSRLWQDCSESRVGISALLSPHTGQYRLLITS